MVVVMLRKGFKHLRIKSFLASNLLTSVKKIFKKVFELFLMTMFVIVNMYIVLQMSLFVIVFPSMRLSMLVLVDMIVVVVMELVARRRRMVIVVIGMVRLNLESFLKFI